MTPALLQRLLGLAAVALLAGLVALAVVHEDGQTNDAAVPTPARAAEGDDGWYVALAGSRGLPGDAQRTTCGTLLTDEWHLHRLRSAALVARRGGSAEVPPGCFVSAQDAHQ